MLRVTYSHHFEETVLFLWLFFFLVGGGVGVLSIKRHVVNLSFIRPLKKKISLLLRSIFWVLRIQQNL